MDGVTLVLLVLKTPELERLSRFYRSLGVALVKEQHGAGLVHYGGKVGDAVLEVYPVAPGQMADSSTRVGLAVPDLQEVMDTLRAAGAPIIAAPAESPWGLRAVVRDPDGRAVELYQR